MFNIDANELRDRLITLIKDNEWRLTYIVDETGICRQTLWRFFRQEPVMDLTLIKLENFTKRHEHIKELRKQNATI